MLNRPGVLERGAAVGNDIMLVEIENRPITDGTSMKDTAEWMAIGDEWTTEDTIPINTMNVPDTMIITIAITITITIMIVIVIVIVIVIAIVINTMIVGIDGIGATKTMKWKWKTSNDALHS